MTTEFSKLQIENPPKQKKNNRAELIHGDGLAKVAGPEEVKGAGHAAAGAMMMENKRKKTGNGNGAHMQPSQMRKGVSCGQRSEAHAHELFAGHDGAAEGQKGS